MSANKKTKEFLISDVPDLEKVDKWWAGLLRKGAKEIIEVEWTSNGDLVWILRITWAKIDLNSAPFNVCMPAYSSYSIDELSEILEALKYEKTVIKNSLKLFKGKIDDWGVEEISLTDIEYETPESHVDANILDFSIDPTLSYATKLDVVEKIMVSEFLWPCYKAMCRSLLMCDAKIEELKKEISYRSNPAYTVVRVDRGMLRTSFLEQVGYDNKWLFATDDELMEDYLSEEDIEDSEE